MAIIPYLDKLAEDENFTGTQKRTIAACQYIVATCTVLVLFWLARNIWTILVKKRKYKVLPLFIFYALGTILIMFRLYTELWLWDIAYKSPLLP